MFQYGLLGLFVLIVVVLGGYLIIKSLWRSKDIGQ